MGITTLLFLGVFLYLSFKSFQKPAYAVSGYLLMYIIYNPHSWYGYQIEQILFRPSLIAALILIIACLTNIYKTLWQFTKNEITIYLFTVTAFIVSFMFGVGVDDYSWQYIEKLLKLNIVLFFLFRSVYTFKDFNRIIWTLILGALFIAIQAHMIGNYQAGRLNDVGGTDFVEANAFAAFMVMNIILLGFKIFKKPWLQKTAIIIPIAVMLNAMVMTQSRAVFIGLCFAGIFVILRSPKRIKKELFVYAILAVVMFGMLANNKFWSRMNTIEEQSRSMSRSDDMWRVNNAPDRIDFWIASISIFKDHPMGIGVKNFETVAPQYDPRNKGMDAHNTYVLCYSEIGIIGIVLFLVINFNALKQLKRIYRLSGAIKNSFEVQITAFSLAAVLIMYLTGPMVTHSYLYPEFTWIILSLPICLEKALHYEIFIQNRDMIHKWTNIK